MTPITKPGEADLTAERVKFEAWARAYGRIFLDRDPWETMPGEKYVCQWTQEAWCGWKARAALGTAPATPVPALPELWYAANAVVHMLPQIDEPRTSRLYAALRDAAGAGQEAAAVQAAGAWQDIATAPKDVLVIVGWRDEEDPENPDRHMFDYLEDGVWANYFSEREHYAIAGVARGRSEDAPYTHWMPMGEIPAALCPPVGAPEGRTP